MFSGISAGAPLIVRITGMAFQAALQSLNALLGLRLDVENDPAAARTLLTASNSLKHVCGFTEECGKTATPQQRMALER